MARDGTVILNELQSSDDELDGGDGSEESTEVRLVQDGTRSNWEIDAVAAGFDEPTDLQKMADGSVLVGQRIFVKGFGAGKVLAFEKKLFGASPHVVSFDKGGTKFVKLQRKTNTDPAKLPWYISKRQ